MKLNSIFLVFLMVLFLILMEYSFSVTYSDFITSKSCSQTWNFSCNSTYDDAFLGCNGTETDSSLEHVEEVYINASAIHPNEEINVTCQFHEVDRGGQELNVYEYIFYFNRSNWITLWSYSGQPSSTQPINKSIIFRVNSSEGPHIVRCAISYGNPTITEGCVSGTTVYDNDDVNFTVVTPLQYSYWNLTNPSTGQELGSGFTATRNSSINISIHYNKPVNLTFIEHNGNGTLANHTILRLNSTESQIYDIYWVNYTLNLSNAKEFNAYNITLSVYSDDEGIWGFNASTPMFFYLDPGSSPNITNFWFSLANKNTTKANLNSNLTIHANASDDVGLKQVKANITYPSKINLTVNLTGEPCYLPDFRIWNFTFNDTIPLNEPGNYTVKIIAVDIGGNETVSSTQNFYVYNNYTLSPLNYVYNRGENISINVSDVNGFLVKNLNWTFNLTYPDNSTKINSTLNSDYPYQINSSDPEGNYSIFVNVSKQGNEGNLTFNFTVSKDLKVQFISPSANTEYTPDSPIGKIRVKVFNARNENLSYPVNVTLHCPNKNLNMSYNESGNEYYVLTGCNSPSSSGTFSISASVSDDFNNTGIKSLSLKVVSGGGGTNLPPSGGVSGGITPPTCTPEADYEINCTDEKDNDCDGATDCADPDCSSNPACFISRPNFNLTLDSERVEVKQGEDSTVIASVFNLGNVPLTLRISLEKECCNLSTQNNLSLPLKGEIDIPIQIHIPLYQPEGEYLVTLKIKGRGSGEVEKTKTFRIIVEKNPLITQLESLEEKTSGLESSVLEYKKLGVFTLGLENLLGSNKNYIQRAKEAIQSDDLATLRQLLSKVQKNTNSVSNSLPGLKYQRILLENKYNITFGVIIVIFSTYLTTQVIVPFYKYGKEIKLLSEEEKSLVQARVEAEKQYFMRKINEQTFNQIMIEKQGKILKLRADLKRRTEERRNLIKQRLHPLAIARWMKSGISRLGGFFKSLPRKAKEKITRKERWSV